MSGRNGRERHDCDGLDSRFTAGFRKQVFYRPDRTDVSAEKFAEQNNGGGKGYAHCNLQRCHAARQCAVYKPCGKSLQPSYRAIGFRICRFISMDKSCQEQDQCGQDSPLQGISRPVSSDCRIAFHIWFPLIPIGSQILLLCLSFFYCLAVVLHHIFLPFFRVSRVCDSIRDAVRIRVGDK